MFLSCCADTFQNARIGTEIKKVLMKYINQPQGVLLAHLQHTNTGKDLYIAVVHITWAKLASPELQMIQVPTLLIVSIKRD